MSKSIAKSPEMIQKEAEVKTLVLKIKKARSTLKGLKTRLANSQQEFVNFQVKIQREVLSRMEKMQTVMKDFLGYVKKLKNAKFLSSMDKMALRDIEKTIGGEDLFGEDFQEYQEKKKKMENGEFEFDDEARAKAKDLFQEFQVEPPKEEKRKIRQVFIGLSSKFHPDKAKTDKEREDFHVLMQDINTAYKNNDIDKLMEMERLYVNSEAIDLSGKAVTVDVLTDEINRLNKELEFIDNQVSRTSKELKNFRKSDFGKALTDTKRAAKAGGGIDEEVEQLQEALTQIEGFRDALKETLEQKQMSPKFYELLSKNMPQEDKMLMDLLGEYGEDDDDDGDFDFDFGDMFSSFDDDDSENEEIKNPKFKIDQMVEVSGFVFPFFYEDVNMKGWTGRITDHYLEDGKEQYVMEFDEKTLKNMPSEFIIAAIKYHEEFSEYAFEKNEIRKGKGNFDEDKIEELQYNLGVRHSFLDKPKEIREVIIEALTLDYEVREGQNWLDYFEANLNLPLNAKIRGLFRGFKRNQKMKIIQVLGTDEEVGIIVECLVGNEKMTPHPLVDLVIDKRGKSKEKLILEAYSTFVKETYDFQ